MTMTKQSIALICVVLSGCTDMVGPISPVPFTPGEVQADAVALINGCAGASVTVSDIDWYTVEDFDGHDGDSAGAWNPPNIVYLVDGWASNLKVNAHEVLHHFLRGDSRHSSALWAGCGVWP